MDFKTTTIKQLHDELVEGRTTQAALREHSHNIITKRDGTINAFIEVFEDDKNATAFDEKNILAGIPMSMKDNILIHGHKASASSKILENYEASYDAHVSELLKAQGALMMGRTNMDELAMGSSTETSYYGITRNPLDESRVPGGSSGGPAASVAAGMVAYALASDTGGSIRQPAAYCGVVGLKPSYGAVSRRGLIAMASSLDVIGPITNCVEDAEVVFNTIAKHDELDSTSVPMEKRIELQKNNTNNKVIGVPRSFLEMEGIDSEVIKNFNEGLEKMKAQGYSVVDIDMPHIHHSLAVYYILQPAEASSNVARLDGIRYGYSSKGKDLLETYVNTRSEGFGKEVQRRIMLGAYVLSSGYHDEYYYKARELRKLITKEINDAFKQVDIIATPTTPGVAFKFGEKSDPVSMYLEDIFTVPYNLSGHPAISIPSGLNTDQMPFGMHFTAPLFCENKLFEVGKDFERVIL